MNERQSRLHEFTSTIGSARIVRRNKLDLLIKQIEEDEKRYRREPRVDWPALGSIERQCTLIDQLLKETEPQQ